MIYLLTILGKHGRSFEYESDIITNPRDSLENIYKYIIDNNITSLYFSTPQQKIESFNGEESLREYLIKQIDIDFNRQCAGLDEMHNDKIPFDTDFDNYVDEYMYRRNELYDNMTAEELVEEFNTFIHYGYKYYISYNLENIFKELIKNNKGE